MGGVAGSGSIISKEGLVLTADHVVAVPYRRIIAEAYNGRTSDCVVVQRNPIEDIAILKCSEFSGMAHVSSFSHGYIGERVICVGDPAIGTILMTSGIISAIYPNDSKFFVDAAIGGGMSGGPVFNLKGEQIGVIQAVLNRPPFVGVMGNKDAIKNTIRAARNKR